MLKRPDEIVLAAIKRLQSDGNFQRFIGWLAESQTALDDANRKQLDATLLRMGQGASQALQEILDRAAGRASVAETALTSRREVG